MRARRLLFFHLLAPDNGAPDCSRPNRAFPDMTRVHDSHRVVTNADWVGQSRTTDDMRRQMGGIGATPHASRIDGEDRQPRESLSRDHVRVLGPGRISFRQPRPIEGESLPMPSNHRIWLDDEKRLVPPFPDSRDPNPKLPIRSSNPQSLVIAVEDRELLPAMPSLGIGNTMPSPELS